MTTARTEAVREYIRSALWLLPVFAVGVALAAGTVLTVVEVPEDSFLDVLVFQGTPDDARTLLFGIAGSVITVMAVMLGLTVVALQLSSTQLSPRLLRNFLQDRPNQVVLAIFVLTFTYATGGLFTVGISRGERIDDYPRLAVTGALMLLFASLFALVYFAPSGALDPDRRHPEAHRGHHPEEHRRRVPRSQPTGRRDRRAPGVGGRAAGAVVRLRADRAPREGPRCRRGRRRRRPLRPTGGRSRRRRVPSCVDLAGVT